MEKETIYEGKVKIDNQPLKIIIEAGLDDAGHARFYVHADKQDGLELMLNPTTHQWEELKDGPTSLSQVCGEIIETYYS